MKKILVGFLMAGMFFLNGCIVYTEYDPYPPPVFFYGPRPYIGPPPPMFHPAPFHPMHGPGPGPGPRPHR